MSIQFLANLASQQPLMPHDRQPGFGGGTPTGSTDTNTMNFRFEKVEVAGQPKLIIALDINVPEGANFDDHLENFHDFLETNPESFRAQLAQAVERMIESGMTLDEIEKSFIDVNSEQAPDFTLSELIPNSSYGVQFHTYYTFMEHIKPLMEAKLAGNEDVPSFDKIVTIDMDGGYTKDQPITFEAEAAWSREGGPAQASQEEIASLIVRDRDLVEARIQGQLTAIHDSGVSIVDIGDRLMAGLDESPSDLQLIAIQAYIKQLRALEPTADIQHIVDEQRQVAENLETALAERGFAKIDIQKPETKRTENTQPQEEGQKTDPKGVLTDEQKQALKEALKAQAEEHAAENGQTSQNLLHLADAGDPRDGMRDLLLRVDKDGNPVDENGKTVDRDSLIWRGPAIMPENGEIDGRVELLANREAVDYSAITALKFSSQTDLANLIDPNTTSLREYHAAVKNFAGDTPLEDLHNNNDLLAKSDFENLPTLET